MSTHILMTAALRDRAGKGNARATRRSGQVPAVIYGDNKPPVLISIENMPIIKALHSGSLFTHLCDLTIDGQNHLVLARDVQLHPVKDTPIHVDFLRVGEKTVVTVEVPLHVINDDKAPGLKAGGVLTLSHHTLEVSCRADRIPESIDIDISALEMNSSIKIEDIKFPANVKSTLDPHTSVVSITPPSEEGDVEEIISPADVEVTNQKPVDANAPTSTKDTKDKDKK
ncbi:MAG: ribosomal rRNA E-loop binding protein [Alphaproteobacteria bacterium]|nr:ribosomal rRNA E-loop binding protein [Alphaproteobacteria bacterium]